MRRARHGLDSRDNQKDKGKGHGTDIPPPPTNTNERAGANYHYHHGLKAGEGTLEASLVRLLVRGMNKKGGAFDADGYLEDYIK